MAHIGGEASADIEAPLEAVWRLVEDVQIAPQWQGGLLSMTALEHDEQGRPTLVESESDIRVRTVKSVVRFSYAEAPRRLAWRQERGDLKSLEGWWSLERLDPGRTRATYGLDGDPGRVIGMLIRGPVEAAIRALLVNARPGELKAVAERA
jgi:hypothetical protein